MSKFPKDSLPLNHVAKAKDPANVQAAQRSVIARQIETLNNAEKTRAGMTLALPKGTIEQYLPSYDEAAGTVDLSDLLNLLTQRMKGTEFYSNGNPTLNRMALQSQVDQIMQSIKQGGKI